VISPASYLKRFQGRDLQSLLIWARHDTSFLPVYSQQVLQSFRELKLAHKVFRAALRPLHHGAVSVQPPGRADHVPVRRAELVKQGRQA